MAGIHFQLEDFRQLLRLNIGIANRIDENRAESFTILYCDFSGESKDKIKKILSEVLRASDTIVNYGDDYFFIMPFTDKYGAETVKTLLDQSFKKYLNTFLISYPVNGETAHELIDVLQNSVKLFCKKDLDYLDILN